MVVTTESTLKFRIGMLTEDVIRRDPPLGIGGEHLPDEVLCAAGDPRPRLAGEVDLPPQDGVEDAVLRLCPRQINSLCSAQAMRK